MNDAQEVLAAEAEFFAALVQGDSDALEDVLADDFIMVDVLSGSTIEKSLLISAIDSGELEFEEITADEVDRSVRLYGGTAVVIGSTRMNGRYAGTPFAANSRYTHVYVSHSGQWRMASAQGTPITT